MPLTRPFALGLLCFTFSALAFDEVGDILVTAVQTNASANSTIKCDRALPIQSSHLAYIRTGTDVVVGRYAATYDSTRNVTAAPAATGDGSNSTFDELTLEARNGSALILTLTDKDGGSVCVYDVRVLEGSVMGLKWADGVPHAKDPPPKKSDDKPRTANAPKDEGSEDGSADDAEDARGDQQDDSGGSGEDGDQPADDAQGEEEQEQPVKPVKKGGKGNGKGNTKKRDEEQEDTDADTDTTTDEGGDGEEAEQEQKPVKKPPVTKGGAEHGTKGAHKGDGDDGDEPAPKPAATRKGAPGQNAKGKGNGGGDAHGLRARVKGKGEGAHTGAKPKPKHKVEDEETEGDNEVRRGLAQAGGKKGQGQSKGKPSDGAAVEDAVDDAPQPKSKPKPKQGRGDKPKQQDALSAEQKREERMYANAKLYEAGVLQVSVLNTTRSSAGAVCNGNSSGSSQQLWVGQLMAFARFALPEGVRSRLDEDQGGWEGNQPKGLWPTVSEPRRQNLAAAAGNPDKEAVEVDVGVDSAMAVRMRTGRDGDKASGLDGVNWNDVGVRERKGGHGPEESTPTAAHWEDVPVPIVQTPDGHLEPLTTTNEVDPGQQSPPQVNWEAETSVIFGQGVTNVRKNELSASIGQAPVGWHLWKLSDGLFVSTERVKQGNTDGSDVPGGCVFAVNVVNGTVFDIQAPNAQPPTAPAHAARSLRSS